MPYDLTDAYNSINDNITGSATSVAQSGVADIDKVLADVRGGTDASGVAQGSQNILDASGVTVATSYGVNNTSGLSITSAAGAMVIDDLMQKISTKVQVAAQLLSTANNISKTVSRIISQG